MVFCYLFEVKSIQQYLFSSGKLKYVVSASERLDRLINTHCGSTLQQVLENANLSSDLCEEIEQTESSIHFLRCKGGAFYAFSLSQAPLETLRSAWTITVAQMFPSLSFTDALVSHNSLDKALDLGHESLAQSRQAPQIKLPLASAISARNARTGKQAIMPSPLDKKSRYAVDSDDALDIDTDLHRQAYTQFNLAAGGALQNKFTPIDCDTELKYELSFDTFTRRDLALVHIDGNGLGILLMALKDALTKKTAGMASEQEKNTLFQQAFRAFSDALCQATEEAAQAAVESVLDQLQAKYPNKAIALRPIVLGGDDVTLFIDAEFALPFAQTFCREFEKSSEAALQELTQQHPSLPSKLTASGGIVYHKVNHPFMQTHHLVEALCTHAKSLTKLAIGNQSDKAGPAALSLYRISNASQQNLESLLEQNLSVQLKDGSELTLGQNSYFVDADNALPSTCSRSFERLQEVVQLSTVAKGGSESRVPVSMAKWRQMMTHIMADDIDEANRIYHRALHLSKNSTQPLETALDKLTPEGWQRENWYWCKGNQKVCMINDLLMLDHFNTPDSAQEQAHG